MKDLMKILMKLPTIKSMKLKKSQWEIWMCSMSIIIGEEIKEALRCGW